MQTLLPPWDLISQHVLIVAHKPIMPFLLNLYCVIAFSLLNPRKLREVEAHETRPHQSPLLKSMKDLTDPSLYLNAQYPCRDKMIVMWFDLVDMYQPVLTGVFVSLQDEPDSSPLCVFPLCGGAPPAFTPITPKTHPGNLSSTITECCVFSCRLMCISFSCGFTECLRFLTRTFSPCNVTSVVQWCNDYFNIYVS